MVVYVDVLLAINFAIDFLLLRVSALLCQTRPKAFRLCMGAALGALGSLIIFFPLKNGFTIAYRIILMLFMCAAVFCPCSKKKYAKAVLCLLLAGMTLSGVLLLWQITMHPVGVAVYAGAVYLDIGVPAMLGCCIAGYAAACVLARIMAAVLPQERLCEITVCNNGERAVFTGLIDTGSSLTEPFSGMPVIVCELGALGKTVPQNIREFSFENPLSEKIRLIPYKTLDSSGLLPAFRAEKTQLRVSDKTVRAQRCYIAVINGVLSEDYRAVCNPTALLYDEKAGEHTDDINLEENSSNL